MRLLTKKGYILICTLYLNLLFSQEIKDSLMNNHQIKISGSFDGYFRTNLNTYNRYYQEDESDAIVPPTSFANKPGFALGMVNVKAEYNHNNIGAVIDLAAGPRAEEAISSDGNSTDLINQLYIHWNPTEKITLTFGRFNTFLGYEVISPIDNFNYSTSYMFSYGPFSHTGLKGEYQFSDAFSGMVAIMNPTDVTSYNPYGTYTLGMQLGYTKDKGCVYLNFLLGDQDGKLKHDKNNIGDTSSGKTFQVDLTTGIDLSSKLYIGFNTTYNQTEAGEIYTATGIEKQTADDSGFWGGALYTHYQIAEKIALGLRTEYFNEFENGVGALGLYDLNGNADVWDITLTGNVALGNLELKPEFRYDFASEAIFAKENGTTQSSLGSLLIAAIYKF
ncbi:hypothetical protein UJ101_01226 [Flavobacteriaceae bacterium UJ101]|nr:hypothetical protein UJ101_01226 [Flavobacteriaceae bacterium UJ101]